jgi:antitoxin HigA-1
MGNIVSASMTNGEFVLNGKIETPLKLKLQIITKEVRMKKIKLSPIHPGEILMEEFLKPMSITQYRLAKDTSVSPRRINEIIHGKRAISADTALRLGKFFGMSAQFWLNLQNKYDLEIAEDLLSDRLDKEVHVFDHMAA